MLPQANKWKAERSRSEPTMSEKPLKEQLTECKNACHGLAVDKAVLQMKDSRLEATITSLQAEVERLQGYADSADAVADGLRIENAALKRLLKFWNNLTESLFDGGGLDDMDLYEMGVECGLLRIEVYDPEGVHKGKNFGCEVVEGDDVYINNLYGIGADDE